MKKEDLQKEINNIFNKHLVLAENIYTSPINECQHKSWGITGGMFKKVAIDCPECKLHIETKEVIDFVEKIGNNDREAIRNVLKRIEILIEDSPLVN